MEKLTAKQAIRQSVSRNEIVHTLTTAELYNDLHRECDDYTETTDQHDRPMVEFWGETEDGGAWRVHAHGAAVPAGWYFLQCAGEAWEAVRYEDGVQVASVYESEQSSHDAANDAEAGLWPSDDDEIVVDFAVCMTIIRECCRPGTLPENVMISHRS